jgi:hypothetical protein
LIDNLSDNLIIKFVQLCTLFFSLTRVIVVAVLLHVIATRPDPVRITKIKVNNSEIKEMFLKCKYKQ